jgi:hypothetical protein
MKVIKVNLFMTDEQERRFLQTYWKLLQNVDLQWSEEQWFEYSFNEHNSENMGTILKNFEDTLMGCTIDEGKYQKLTLWQKIKYRDRIKKKKYYEKKAGK